MYIIIIYIYIYIQYLLLYVMKNIYLKKNIFLMKEYRLCTQDSPKIYFHKSFFDKPQTPKIPLSWGNTESGFDPEEKSI